jgi:hypothetical protein
MFGNITGGGTLSSKTDYAPTKYIATYNDTIEASVIVVVLYYYDNRQVLV